MNEPHEGAAGCWERVPVTRWIDPGGASAPGARSEPASDAIAMEAAVSLSYNGLSHVVMMMTPADLEDFALGFSLSEGIVERPAQIYDIVTQAHAQGLEIAITIGNERFQQLKDRRRNLAGRTGCGLCGAESLEQAVRPVPAVDCAAVIEGAAVQRALDALDAWQPLQRSTGAAHGAAWCASDGGIVLAREDVGRHNALDKLVGALARAPEPRGEGFALVSSRASYEMVGKAAQAGIGILVAVSAPTAFAVRLAAEAGITLVAFARTGRLSVYSRPERLV
ncbi:MAG: formate dehydrogenase accessory sulfurtransferase FdhD [Gammaproteobacteria bacterium]|nr:formate dehydrogenase accessory sulfurtransferase FdhD [Gammaproteobacteria bacterium]MBK8991300.1 formate dehydrogenase accessory sulfurtransferase FdhD [Gammaproteobacteria bacterium]MBK9467209.1 formate dehydrogenase accessory sulfurtransferase FdhD [Gammaproteobacteria bacterium]MBP7908454.1 formate dehydrogenase accessory sulfurtransferase FdhD [Pseudomonadales bacterium]